MPGAPMNPPGWYPDPTADQTVRWWDGSQWTAHQAVMAPDVPGPGTRTHRPAPTHIRVLTVLAALTLVSIPVNWFTFEWGRRAAQSSTQCGVPLTWDQNVLGIYLPLLFMAVALGCLVAGIVVRVRSRRTERPLGTNIIVLSAVGLVVSVCGGFLAALAVSANTWCF